MIARPIRNLGLWLVVATAAVTARGQGAPALRVRVDLDPGPRYVGESFELRLTVVAGGEEPTVTLPELEHARMAVVETFTKPIRASSIGPMIALEQLHLFQCRVVADAPGTLEIPPIEAQDRDKVGRSRPARIEIRAVPSAGRPADFLGGVGRFEIEAMAEPAVVRVGERIVYKIKATGPGALGMIDRPSLARFKGLAIPVEIRPGRDQTSFEPPSRTFVYEIRPLSAGEVTLPPVSAAAFDPAVKRYMTRATHGLPIRAIAVPFLDSSVIAPAESEEPPRRNGWWYAVGASAMVVLVAFVLVFWRRWRPRQVRSVRAARRHAARVARRLRATSAVDPDRADQLPRELMDHLGCYLAAGLGRPLGALSPAEARAGVAEVSRSPELGDDAARLAESCDQWLYGPEDVRPPLSEIHDSARHLFGALGRARIFSIRGVRMGSAPRTELAGSPDPER